MKMAIKRIPLYFLATLAFMCAAASFCSADEIILINGARLPGKLVNINNEKVTFKLELIGVINVDISKIESITTDEPVEINFDDGKKIRTTKVVSKDGNVSIENIETAIVKTVPPYDIFSVKKPGKSIANWKGDISGGVTSTDNDEDTITFNTILKLQRRSPKHRLRFRGVVFLETEKDSETRRRESTEENYTLDIRYDYFLTKKYFLFFSENYKRDLVNDLDYRLITGSGLGYQWIDTAKKHLDIIAGFAYTTEQYTTHTTDYSDRSLSFTFGGSAENLLEAKIQYGTKRIEDDNSYLAYLFGINFDWELWGNLFANLDATIAPNVEEPSEYIARGFGGAKLMVTKSLFVNFSTIFEYNSEAKQSDSTDTKFLLGFGWNFL
jgi:hypothetical protein